MSLHLTSRQSDILEFIRARVARDGQSPTLEEIGRAMGLPHVSAVL
jgi:repressor LexA